ncbi:flagellar hook-length control protein FliK [Oryzomonas sagensis]|uniref:Flagellar hook-length control protein FliK n=1 Tax=Oryzomonas sagensis TaxID=2603857 RepID=A0ABQ6TRH8_9BACT|nr:flagellar hook-length control protein FliK [Oryzomonas sagensis]KAB0671631.1 flagellar hook-length control protein FliK [Oryzomonas sagensis]
MAIPTDIQSQVYNLLSQASNLSFVSAEQEAGARVSFVPGQQVSASVLTTLPNNLTQVQIGTERFNLALPMAVRPGQTLEMTFVAGEPRSTFAVARQGVAAPPVSLSDASRLLSLLVGSEEIVDPSLRASLLSISDMLRRSPGEAGVLANLMDEALTYGAPGEGETAPTLLPDVPLQQGRAGQEGTLPAAGQGAVPEQTRLSSFEANAARILQNIARNSRFDLTEAANQPVTPLPLMPGEEVDAAVLGTVPGGKVFVQLAGTSLELLIPRPVQAGDILRLTFITSDPRPLFALQRAAAGVPSSLSEAGRWLSALEHGEGGGSTQQMYVLERLNTVLKSLPPDSPAFTAIQDEAITYQTVMRGRQPVDQQPAQPGAALQAGAAAVQNPQATLQPGTGIVLSDDMAKLLQALIRGNRLALLEAINQEASGEAFSPGQQVRGEITASLGGGRFMVQVAGQAMEFMLPKGIKRGDMVTLFFVTDEPQPTFLMTRFGKPGDARVSETGRWLSGFLGAAGDQMPAREALGILRTLLSEPPSDASRVSGLLQRGLRDSGLFYESHLARWFGGDYPLEDLLREPQGRLSPLQRPPGQEAAGNTAQEMALAGLKGGSVEVMEAALKTAGTATAHEGIVDQQALPVVKEQLAALQSGQVLFRGDLVPGQQVEWAVREREAHRNESGEQTRSWETSLTLDMPKLGNVTASLKLDGSRVSIELNVAQPDSAELLKAGLPRLAEQLEASGLVPSEIGVTHEIP